MSRLQVIVIASMYCLVTDILAIKVISHDGACRATTDQGIIDLSSSGNTDGTAKFKDIQDPLNYYITYEFNPCKDFTDTGGMGGGCQKVAVCEISSQYGIVYNGMGDSSSASWKVAQDGNVTISYSDGSTGFSSNIKLLCSKTAASDTIALDSVYPSDPTSPTFILTSKHCCVTPAPTTPPSSSTGGLSTGSILCIILLAVVFLYIVGGLAYTVGYKKYDGRERIPNAKLWGELPGLVKDGAKFTLCCGWRAGSSGGKYDQL